MQGICKSLQRGASLLSWACYLNRTDVVTLLLDNGANVDLPTVSKSCFVLHHISCFTRVYKIAISLRWQVSKLIFTRAQNDNFQYGKLQSQTVANGHQNIVCIIKGVSPASFVR